MAVSVGIDVFTFSVIRETLGGIIRSIEGSPGDGSLGSGNRDKASGSSFSFPATCSIVKENSLRRRCHCVSFARVSRWDLSHVRVVLSVFRMKGRSSKNGR